jgi:hypothetical protein
MRVIVTFAFVLLAATMSLAQEITVQKASEPPATELAAPIQALLAADAIKVTTAPDASLTFWWATSLPVKADAVGWAQVAEGTIVGAVRVTGAQKDARGRRVKQPAVYVLRYGIQPQTGDHLGVSPFRDFLLLVPALLDKAADPLPHDKLIELSPRAISVSEAHPTVLSLDPPMATAEPLTVQTMSGGQKSVIFEVPTASGSKLRFGLILVGDVKP